MIEVDFLFGLAFVWLVFAAVSDYKTREIPNWLNFSLVIFALGFRFFYSLFSSGDFSFFYYGVLGYIAFFVLAEILYYSKVFAGGDATLMKSVGAVLPIFPALSANIGFALLFLFLFFFVGALYGVFGSIFISLKHFKKFKKGFGETFSKNKKGIILGEFFGLLLLIGGFYLQEFFFFGIIVFLFPYFFVFLKSVDEYCMVHEVPVSKITPGDWLYEDVKIGSKTIKSNWNGLSEDEIKILRKSKKKVLLKYGIIFAPVFLISFVLLWITFEFNLFQFLLKIFGA